MAADLGIGVLLLGAVWNVYDNVQLVKKHDAYAAAVAARDGGATLTDAQNKAIAASGESARTSFKASPERIPESVRQHTSGYATAFIHIAEINTLWQTWGSTAISSTSSG